MTHKSQIVTWETWIEKNNMDQNCFKACFKLETMRKRNMNFDVFKIKMAWNWIFSPSYQWTGCPEGFHGVNCSQPCSCPGLASCDHVTGSCNCPAGRFGKECKKGKNQSIWGSGYNTPPGLSAHHCERTEKRLRTSGTSTISAGNLRRDECLEILHLLLVFVSFLQRLSKGLFRW